MGQGGFVYCTASRQINSSPTLPPLITAKQKMRICSYVSASYETLWTRIKAKGCVVDESGRRIKSWQHLFENARPNMISEKSILLKMRDGPTESPSKFQIQ